MKRSLFFCVVALMAGVYTAYFAADAIPVTGIFCLAWVLFISLFFTKRGRLPFVLVFLFLFGAFNMQGAQDVTGRPLFPYVNEYITIRADAVEEPVFNEESRCYHMRAMVRQVSFLKERAEMEEIVQLRFNEGEKVPAFGERFSAVVLFSLPRDNMNSSGFDYSLYLKANNIYFVGSVEQGTIVPEGNFPLGLKDKIYQYNRLCGRWLSAIFPKEAASVFRSVSLGDKSLLSEEVEEKLQISGLSHVTAVSGMHVTSLVTMLYLLYNALKQNRYRLLFITGGFILCFMLFTGMTPSVVRASLMILCGLIAPLFFRRADSLSSLALAAGVIVLCHSPAALDVGFMLSFGASAGIILFADPICALLVSVFQNEDYESRWFSLVKGICSVVAVTLSAQIFMLPLSSWLFGYVSVWSLISNLLTTLLMPVILVSGLLTGILGAVHPALALLPAGLGYPFIKLFLMIVHFLGEKPEGLLTVGSFSAFGVYLYGLGLLVFYRILHRKFSRCLVPAVSLVVLLLVYVVWGGSAQVTEITFVNVGQGDCTLLELPNRMTVLIDGGGVPSYKNEYDVGREIVLPYLRKKGIDKLDYVVATHPHEDHIGGLSSVVTEVQTEMVLIPENFEDVREGAELLEVLEEEQISFSSVSAGDEIVFDKNCRLEILLPDAVLLEKAENENDLSLVLKFSFHNNVALFTGDIEEEAEEYLMEVCEMEERVQLVKVAHHGSLHSTSSGFLNWANPQYAYIPCGKNNYGHPHEEVLERLSSAGTVVYRADTDKDVSFIFDKAGIRSIRKGG